MLDESRWEYVSVIDRAGHSIRNDLYHKPEEVASYIIWKDGDKIYAKNGHTGQIEFSGTDAASVIQQSINALTAGRTWKEKVVLKGEFEVGSQINIPSYTIIEIQGKIRVPDGATLNLFWIEGENNVEIVGGILDGNKIGGTLTHLIVPSDGCSNVVIRNVKIINSGGTGIHIRAPNTANKNIQILNCHVEGCKSHGIDVRGATGIINEKIQILNCRLKNNAEFGIEYGEIFLMRCKDVIVANNLIESSYGQGIKAETDVYNLIVANNIVKECNGAGIVLGGGTPVKNVDIVNNYVENCGKSNNTCNINITAGKPDYYDINHINIINNIVIGSDAHGIILYGRRANIKHNIVIDSGMDRTNVGATYVGISVKGDYISIQGNLLYNPSKTIDIGITAFGVDLPTDYISIVDNNILSGFTTPISNYGAHSITKRNIGYVTENSGVATVSAGNSYVDVPHGLAGTPTKIIVTPKDSDPGDRFWISDVGSSTFRINLATAPATDKNFYWEAEI